MNRRLLIIPLLVFSFAADSQNPSLDSIIKVKMQQMHLPGLSTCTIHNNKITWSGYYGYQNVEKKIPVTRNTLFLIASVGKTINASAVSQLLAQKKIQLEDDINNYLPFTVRNPFYPEIPITVGELLRHRSSIQDNLEYLQPIWDTSKGDPRIPLDVFLRDYLVEGGTHYNKQKNFLNSPPNSTRSYCNTAFGLLGYIVERISKLSYDQYCKKNIFEPLDMSSTAFFLRDIDTSHLATPYHYSDSLHVFIPYAQGGYPDYPAGLIRSTAEQLAHFLIAWCNNGVWRERKVFDSAIIQLITPSDMRMGCYAWNLVAAPQQVRPKLVYAHSGGDNGTITLMLYQPEEKKGMILLFNGELNRSADNLKNLLELFTVIYESIE